VTDPSVTPAGPSRARKMRQDFIEFAPSHLPFLITNNLLKVPADDPALWARLLVMPFWRTVNQCPCDIRHLPGERAMPRTNGTSNASTSGGSRIVASPGALSALRRPSLRLTGERQAASAVTPRRSS
jgi:putative DNA primase/helicase